MAIHTLKRRDGTWYRYFLSYLDSKTIAILEIAEHEPTRKLCVVDVSHAEELQDLCDQWNEKNQREANMLCAPIDFD